MQSDYSHINDIVYDISGDVKLMFHTVISSYNSNNGMSYSNYNEYKTSTNNKSHTMIKRSLSYYLFFEDRRDKTEKICIYPENMFVLLDRLEYIKHNWIDNDIGLYVMMDNMLVVSNPDEYIFMKLPMDKAIKISPGIWKTELGDMKCIDLYLNSNNPIQLTHERFLGMYYVMKGLDMLNYANTCISFAMLMNTPINRTDFSSSAYNTPLTDTSNASGTKGMTIEKSNKSAFFDE
jgi:hypothetical protein